MIFQGSNMEAVDLGCQERANHGFQVWGIGILSTPPGKGSWSWWRSFGKMGISFNENLGVGKDSSCEWGSPALVGKDGVGTSKRGADFQ